jgi:hypothetical protein
MTRRTLSQWFARQLTGSDGFVLIRRIGPERASNRRSAVFS